MKDSLEPLEHDFGWSRATTSGAVSLNLILYGLTAPFAAALMERFGVRRTVAVALVLVSLGSGLTVFMTSVPDMVSRWVPGTWLPLGTDGFGRSDTRELLRRHFEVDHGHVVVAVLSALFKEGQVKAELVADAIARYGIDPEAPNPVTA